MGLDRDIFGKQAAFQGILMIATSFLRLMVIWMNFVPLNLCTHPQTYSLQHSSVSENQEQTVKPVTRI